MEEGDTVLVYRVIDMLQWCINVPSNGETGQYKVYRYGTTPSYWYVYMYYVYGKEGMQLFASNGWYPVNRILCSVL